MTASGLAVLAVLCVLSWSEAGFAAENERGPEGPSRADCADTEEGACEPVLIDAIEIAGLERTKPFVVHRELLVEEGETASRWALSESIQRVRNTGLFRKVTYELVESGPEKTGAYTLEIEVDERWTTLPMFQYSNGGGTYRLIAGAYDTNFLGRYLGLGGRYERLGETNSFYAWAYDPRAFDQRQRGG